MDKKKNGHGPGTAETIVLLIILNLLALVFRDQIGDAVTVVLKIIGCIMAGTGEAGPI